MTGTPFHLVDVFAERRYAGNQLAVVESRGSLSDGEMLEITREMNYSETTFVEGDPVDGAWPVRIFTQKEEIPFAGHPTLGTAAVLRERFDAGDDVTLGLGVGDIPVEVRPDGSGETEAYWMTQNAPEFGAELDHARLVRVLGLDDEDVDREWPVQVVSTGLPSILVPLTDRDALGRVDVDRTAYDALYDETGVENVFPFCADPREADHHLAARMFSPGHGLHEDPATGSANGNLAGYLARHRYFGDGEVAVSVEQGYEMGRPSVLHLEAEDGDEVSVRVGGRVEFVAEGDLL